MITRNSEKINDRINEAIERLLTILNLYTLLLFEIKKDNSKNHQLCSSKELVTQLLKKNKGPLTDEVVMKVFNEIFNVISKFVGICEEKNLLVGASGISEVNMFNSINEMFNFKINKPIVIAGPCAIENYNYLDEVAQVLSKKSIKFIRGGAYKPRTSPYDFQGIKEEGLKILYEVSKKYDLISTTEVVDTRYVEIVSKYTDILQVGARNMQNYELLKEVGRTHKPVILKRGMSASIKEFIYAAEYIALQGSRNIILCERGIRTFETSTRNTLDISSIPIIKNETCLPIIVDLSHSLGRKDIIVPIAKSVLAAEADGIMVEVHPNPELALSDKRQQLNIDEFTKLLDELRIGENG
ncbi:MAG: bifunctional 3-deoxy-7-phosphoheptulonate synthase/chorismate mutase [Firmicutes bacterium]|nr:bifunctional 3-deoxy-7-phosphoheptulonate synthase/chorismate mutase [Bacillota bacterium]